jgi:curved DNA-binding protein CbpA
MTDDLYETLGVARDASPEEIHRAYRKRAMDTHPDQGGTSEAFGAVALAHRILSDDQKRARYDRTGRIDDEADNTDAIALELIEQLLNGAVQDPDAKHKDLIGHMSGILKASMEEAQAAIGVFVRQEHKILDLLKRFRTKNDRNVVSMLLNRRLDRVRGQVAAHERSVAAHKRAIEILKDYTFDTEVPPGFNVFFPTTNHTNTY